MKLFRLDSSIIPDTSTSSELADTVEAEWKAVHPQSTVVRRHLGTDPLPADIWATAAVGGYFPEEARTPAQHEAIAFAKSLADEVSSADAVLIAVPMYNFGVDQHVKTWIDLVIAGASVGDELLKGKPTVLVTSRGGGYGPGTPRAGWDHGTPYMRRILGDVWQGDLTVIERELTLAHAKPEMEALRGIADQSREQALGFARETGKAIAVSAAA